MEMLLTVQLLLGDVEQKTFNDGLATLFALSFRVEKVCSSC